MKNLIIITFLLLGINSYGQSHNTTTGSACKFAKNRCTNMEGCPQCAACNAEDKKEKDAKAAEVKRRNDKIWADAKAKKDAEDKAYRDKIAKEAAYKKRKEEQAIADKKASDELNKKYQEIANKGIVKSDVKGKDTIIELKDVKEFWDTDRKIYGFKLEGKEVATFPFIEDQTFIYRINHTNFFEVRIFKNEGKYNNPNYKYSVIIDHLGNRLKIDNNDQFINITDDTENKVIYLYVPLNTPEFITDNISVADAHYNANGLFNNRESAIARANKSREGWGMFTKKYLQNVTQYTVDYNLNTLKKDKGWIILVK